MISKTFWNRILYMTAGLVIMVVIIIIFYIIPQVKSAPNATPERAVPAFWGIVLFQLLIVAALIYSIMFSHKEGHFENGFLVTAGVVQKPDALTSYGRFNSNYHKYFNNKHLIPARNGQFTPAESGQG